MIAPHETESAQPIPIPESQDVRSERWLAEMNELNAETQRSSYERTKTVIDGLKNDLLALQQYLSQKTQEYIEDRDAVSIGADIHAQYVYEGVKQAFKERSQTSPEMTPEEKVLAEQINQVLLNEEERIKKITADQLVADLERRKHARHGEAMPFHGQPMTQTNQQKKAHLS